MKRILLLLLACAIIGVIFWSTRGDGAEPQPESNPAGAPVEPSTAPDGKPEQARPGTGQPASGGAKRTQVQPEVPTPAADPSQSMLRGRLVFADGRPVRDASCSSWIQRGHQHRYLEMETDANGRFTMALPDDFDGPGRILTVRSKVADRIEGSWTVGQMGLAETFPLGVTNIGDITVAELPLMASGKVQDTTGAGIAQAAVYAMPEGFVINEMRNPRLPEMFRCDTDARGRFRICGKAEGLLGKPAGPHILVVRRTNMFQTATPTFKPGASGLVVVMAAAGAVSGSIALTPNFDPTHVSVELSGEPVEGHTGSADSPVISTRRPLPAGTALRVELDEDGRFHTDLLRPGLLGCAVRVRGRTEPVLEIGGVRIEPARTCVDPRLQDMDLSGLRTVALHFMDASSAVQLGPMPVGIRESGQTSWNRRVLGRGGILVVSTTTGMFDVLAQQRGYRRELIENVGEDRTILLHPGIEVLATLQLAATLPPRFEMSLRLVGAEVEKHPGFENVQVPRSRPVVAVPGETVTLTVPAPGRYRPMVRVQSKGGPRDERIDAEGVTPEEIVVPESGITAPLVIKLDEREALRACVVIQTFFPTAVVKTPK